MLKNFIESLKQQVNTSREKRKELMDKLKKKENQNIDSQVLKDKTDECEKIARNNEVLENEMQSNVIKLEKEIEDKNKNEESLTRSLKDRSNECCRLNCENDQLRLELMQSKNYEQELERKIIILRDELTTANEYYKIKRVEMTSKDLDIKKKSSKSR